MVDDVTAAAVLTVTGEPPLAPLAAIPPDLASLADYEARAPAHLPAATWRHIAEGSGDGLTLADNRAAFARLRLRPRALADLAAGTTMTTLLGAEHAAPILVAPLAYAAIAHPAGEMAIAQGAAAIGLGMTLSTLASISLEAVATAHAEAVRQLGTRAPPPWFQLYLQPRRQDSLALVRRAEDAGYAAIVLTIDAGVKRSGFVLPTGIGAANLAGIAPPRQHAAPGGRILFGTPLIDQVPTWADLAWLRGATALPVVVKGIVLGADVARLVDAGADALVLSNHGGRVLDGLPATIDVLEEVVAATRLPVLLDGGVRSGTDIVKALCLGASAVLVGRPVLHALAIAGLPGVAHALHLLHAELEAAMAQLGCATLADLTPERVMRR